MLETFWDTLNTLKILSVELVIFGLIFFLIEKIRPAEKNVNFFKSDFKEELGLALLNASIFQPIFNIIVAGGIIALISSYIPYQIFDQQLQTAPVIVQVIAICFIIDFSTYWRHRVTHTFKILWPFHSIHHAAQHLNWLTSMRLHPVDLLIATLFDVIILHVFGFSTPTIAIGFIIFAFYNHFTHANIDLKFEKPVRYIFASPNFHRWHHATAYSAYNKNFCAMFSFLDLIFGTYYHPEDLPEGYGLEPHNQKNYPKSLIGWLKYPFRKTSD
ncbi:MAG: sterol desaturase family protein [Bdellovibrionales bacterium]